MSNREELERLKEERKILEAKRKEQSHEEMNLSNKISELGLKVCEEEKLLKNFSDWIVHIHVNGYSLEAEKSAFNKEEVLILLGLDDYHGYVTLTDGTNLYRNDSGLEASFDTYDSLINFILLYGLNISIDNLNFQQEKLEKELLKIKNLKKDLNK